MNYIKYSDAQAHDYYDGAVQVTEFNFSGNDMMNDAEITITGRYPTEGYAVNDISLALVSIESGSGIVAVKDSEPQKIETGDRILIKPGEPYFFKPTGKLAIRYIATPAWTVEQSRIIEE
jgi:hypothetical protein